MNQLNIRIDSELMARLKMVAAKSGKKISAIVRDAIIAELNKGDDVQPQD